MSREEEPFELIPDESNEYVPAVFARSVDEAEYFRELLNDHDIPAIIGTEDKDESTDHAAMSRGVPVLVPDAFLDEASEIIADREDLDEFEDDEEDQDEEDEEDEFTIEEVDGEEDEEDEEDEEPAEGDEEDDFLEEGEEESEEGEEEGDEEEDEEE